MSSHVFKPCWGIQWDSCITSHHGRSQYWSLQTPHGFIHAPSWDWATQGLDNKAQLEVRKPGDIQPQRSGQFAMDTLGLDEETLRWWGAQVTEGLVKEDSNVTKATTQQCWYWRSRQRPFLQRVRWLLTLCPLSLHFCCFQLRWLFF